ncbi:unnamed protein product [Protopolystoma xenopodis]|uniref:Uncharacterized protein n=1 Tax=Protopolystoma xenopodis TaxID=117903 RepID=A0A448XA81_9PLAT|nr:unnamed protein product [Protopolystoma xenopodis]
MLTRSDPVSGSVPISSPEYYSCSTVSRRNRRSEQPSMSSDTLCNLLSEELCIDLVSLALPSLTICSTETCTNTTAGSFIPLSDIFLPRQVVFPIVPPYLGQYGEVLL